MLINEIYGFTCSLDLKPFWQSRSSFFPKIRTTARRLYYFTGCKFYFYFNLPVLSYPGLIPHRHTCLIIYILRHSMDSFIIICHRVTWNATIGCFILTYSYIIMTRILFNTQPSICVNYQPVTCEPFFWIFRRIYYFYNKIQ